jgi:hypothetical protein
VRWKLLKKNVVKEEAGPKQNEDEKVSTRRMRGK